MPEINCKCVHWTFKKKKPIILIYSVIEWTVQFLYTGYKYVLSLIVKLYTDEIFLCSCNFVKLCGFFFVGFQKCQTLQTETILLCIVIISLYVMHSTYIRSQCTKKFQENSCLFPLSVERKTEEGTGVAVERKIGGTVNS